MNRTEFLRILENVIKQDESSQSLTQLLIDLLDKSNTDIEKELNRLNDNFFAKKQDNFYNENIPQGQGIDITEHNFSNNHYLKKYNSDKYKENEDMKDNNYTSYPSKELISIFKRLLNDTSNGVSITDSRREQGKVDISSKNPLNNDFLDDYENSGSNNSVHKSLGQYGYSNLNNNEANFVKSISMQNKSGNFRYTFIYEHFDEPTSHAHTNKPLNYEVNISQALDSKDISTSEEFEQKYNKQNLDNKDSIFNREDNINIYKENTSLQNSLLRSSNQPTLEKQRGFNKNSYEPSYINKYKSNFKPIKYVRVTKPSDKLSDLLKNRGK